MSDSSSPGDGALTPGDREVLAGIRRGNDWTRSLLCTLARRGIWLRQHHPERAGALLAAVAPWPWYKAGQFIFDLFEWEDFMLDGPAPRVLDGQVDAVTIQHLAGVLRLAVADLDSAGASNGAAGDGATGDRIASSRATSGGAPPGETGPDGHWSHFTVPADELPALEPGLHLYPDVVLGVLLASSNAALESRRGGSPGHQGPGR